MTKAHSMSPTDLGLLDDSRRNHAIRLRTITLLRWVAIGGQLIAILVAQQLYNLQLELGWCYLAIGVSVIGNLVAMFVFPENKRLTEYENLLMVMFDLLQLCFLLFLTGGLNNPFSLMVLGPVVTSATVLSVRSTVLLNVTAFLLISVMATVHMPLVTNNGETLELPRVFIFGSWTAITIALVFISVYARRMAAEMGAMSDALSATQMALARAQKLSDLGGVVAAAAHELGTPLATIKLASAELIDELDDQPDLQEDARLIRAQADCCRDILHGMGRAGKDDLHMRSAPLSEVIREAAEPHEGRGKTIEVTSRASAGADGQPPEVLRRPEVIHGLRNLIQNAVDFARSTVWVDAIWSPHSITIRIIDDGQGYPPHLIGRLGDPLMRRRRSETDKRTRPEYEGMGLGLFIAKTLLERSGADVGFANGSPDPQQALRGTRQGAIVEVVWPRSSVEAPPRKALGENRKFED